MNNLDTAIAALRPTKGSRRPKGQVFTLTLGLHSATLQGPRGNVLVEYVNQTPERYRAMAAAHVARFPGATLQVY